MWAKTTKKKKEKKSKKKKMWNMKETVIPIVVSTLGTAHKGLEKWLRESQEESRPQNHLEYLK